VSTIVDRDSFLPYQCIEQRSQWLEHYGSGCQKGGCWGSNMIACGHNTNHPAATLHTCAARAGGKGSQCCSHLATSYRPSAPRRACGAPPCSLRSATPASSSSGALFKTDDRNAAQKMLATFTKRTLRKHSVSERSSIPLRYRQLAGADRKFTSPTCTAGGPL
jgi:hypothetical protein